MRALFRSILLTIVLGCSVDRASNTGVVDADALPILTIEEVVRIGSANDPNVGFAAIGAMNVSDGDTAFVFESRDQMIRVYGPSGKLTRTIAGPGDGPGEFTSVTRVGLRGDTLWAVEAARGRILLFDRSGVHLQTSVANTLPGVRPRALLRGGVFSSEPISRGVQQPRVYFDMRGEVLDTVGIEPTPIPSTGQLTWQSHSPPRIDVNGASYAIPRPPGDAPLWLSLDDGSALIRRARVTEATDAEFTVTRFDARGDTSAHLRLRYTPGRYEGAVLDTIAMRPVARMSGDPAAFNAVRAALDYPPFQSPIYAAWAAEDGTLWMRREDNGGSVFRWVVINPDGTVRGVVLLGRSTDPIWSQADMLWATEADLLGVLWLVRYRIVGSLGGRTM